MIKNPAFDIKSNLRNLKINESIPSESSEESESVAVVSGVQKYLLEWENLSSGDEAKWKHLCASAKCGGLRTSYFRSVCWRLMLNILPASRPNTWSGIITSLRADYDALKKEHFVSPREEDVPVSDHPLSQDTEQSKWHKYFCDNELKTVIKQDIIRTFPGVEFFRDLKIQEHMLNILFCYARKNPKMCYRQGMHEILAPILFVLNADTENFFCVRETEELSEIISQLMNPDYLEHDSFCIFSTLMQSIEIYYQTAGPVSSSGYFPTRIHVSTAVTENPVITQLNFIKDSILKPIDPDLESHLSELSIPFSTFGIRWLRLLFGREFEFEDLLVLWDALFSEGPRLSLINFIVVALLLSIRYNLLRCDYSECLSLLMKFPHSVSVVDIVRVAMQLRDDSQSERGLCPIYKVAPPVEQSSTQGARKKETIKQRPKTRPTSNRRTVIDGIAFNKNKTLKNLQDELSHMQMLLTICRDKLAQYHPVLDAGVLIGNTPARQAVEGLSQLHLLLDDYFARLEPKPVDPVTTNEIETAYEANEGPSILSNSPAPMSKAVNRGDLDRELKELPKRTCTEETQEKSSVSEFPTVNPVGYR
nr:PREDICTED: TBC1 domain family member 5 [Bemisia tabaci]